MQHCNKKITIYSIKFNNNIIYIGQTSKSINHRWADHRYRTKKELNIKGKLYNKIRKYGIEKFSIEPLCVVESHMADETEEKCISIFDTIKNGCNTATGGMVNKGMKKTPEQIEHHKKISKKLYEDKKTGLVKWNGSNEQKEFLKRIHKGKQFKGCDNKKNAREKSHGPYKITVDGTVYTHEEGFPSFAKIHGVDDTALYNSFKQKRAINTKGHIVFVERYENGPF